MPRRMSGCNSRQPHQFNRPCASLRDRISKIPFARGSTETACQSSWGRGRKVMHLPCKQADVGALPTDSTNLRPAGLRLGRPFHRGELD